MNHTFLAYLAIFAPTFGVAMAAGLLLGWYARGWWRKGEQALNRIIAGQDIATEWREIWQDVRDEAEDE